MARELRDWGAAQCGRFAALAGIGTMAGTLLTGPSMRLFGAKGHTVISSTMSAWCSVILGSATSNASGVVPHTCIASFDYCRKILHGPTPEPAFT